MDLLSFFTGVVVGLIPTTLIALFLWYRKYEYCRQERDDLHARAVEAERRVRWYQVKGCAPPTGYAPMPAIYPIGAKRRSWAPRAADASYRRIGVQPGKRLANRMN